MKNRPYLVLAAGLGVAATLTAGSTLAYFSDYGGEKTNVFTVGNVDAELIDRLPENYTPGANGWQAQQGENGITYTEILPGDSLSKEVGFSTGADSAESYVALRVQAVVNSLPNGGTQLTQSAAASEIKNLVVQQVQAEGADRWSIENSVGDPYTAVFFYNEPVQPGTRDVLLFDTVDIPADWGNLYAGIQFRLEVDLAAVQARNLTAEQAQEQLMQVFVQGGAN